VWHARNKPGPAARKSAGFAASWLLAAWVVAAVACAPTIAETPERAERSAGAAASLPDEARPAAKPPISEDDYARHVDALKKRLPAEGYTIVIEPPFVVIGDGPPDEVRRCAVDTVRWAVDRLKKEYFPNDPAEILDIWLFQNSQSYRKHCETLFKAKSDSPYGFFSAADRALVMNIATGGGTLVHEIVHPLMAANFPDCPPWLNEGLGSLYEQCEDRRSRIHGRTNWRLEGLQKAIGDKKVPSFEALCKMDSKTFYGPGSGIHYAQARYLCYYLQQHSLLKKFYHELVANQRRDPTGFQTLQAVLGRSDMVAFQKHWEAYVLRLTFP
jgi:hypothetical protein